MELGEGGQRLVVRMEEFVTEGSTDNSQCKGAQLMSPVEDDTGTAGIVCCTDQED